MSYLAQLKGLIKIYQSERPDLLITLPDNLCRALLELGANSTPTNLKQDLQLISTMDFPIQAYCLRMLCHGQKERFDNSLVLYKTDPQILREYMEIESSLGISLSNFHFKELKTLNYIKAHPFILKTLTNQFQNDEVFLQIDFQSVLPSSTYIDLLIERGKENWIEKLCLLFKSDMNLLNYALEYLGKASIVNPSIVAILSQETSLIREFLDTFSKLAKQLFTPFIEDPFAKKPALKRLEERMEEAVGKLLGLLTHENRLLFKTFSEILIDGEVNETINILEKLELLPETDFRSQILDLVSSGYSYIALAGIFLDHKDLFSSDESLNLGEKLERIVRTYPPETQAALNNILLFWGKGKEKAPYALLEMEQNSLIAQLLKVKHPEAFSVIARCCCYFPLPEAQKLFILKNFSIQNLNIFDKAILNYPEMGWWLLEYLSIEHLNPGSLSERVFNDKTWITNRNPLKALETLLNYNPKYVKRPLQFFPQISLSNTGSIKKIENLLKSATVEQKVYLYRLCLLETQHPNSLLVAELLFMYPNNYPSLVSLALSGYSKEAQDLLARVESESSLSPWTAKMLKMGTPNNGSWVTAALQLNEKENVVQYLTGIEDLTDLAINITYLSAAGQKQTLDAIFKAMQKPNDPSSQALLQWVAEGSLSFANWICNQDLNQKDTIYQQIRQMNPAIQKQVILLYRNLILDTIHHNFLTKLLSHPQINGIVSQALYAQVHMPKEFEALIKSHTLDFIPFSSSSINTLLITNTEETLSKTQKALKAQFHFAVVAAEQLVNYDGSINISIIEELKKTDFFVKEQQKGTEYYKYLEWVFSLFKSSEEFSERLKKAATIPMTGSPALLLVQQTLTQGLGTTPLEITLRNVQVAVLSALLQRPWQSPGIGSCFGTAVVIQTHSSKALLLQTLDDYLTLIKTSSLTRRGQGNSQIVSVEFPLSMRLETTSYEHPLAKSREFCIASMGSTINDSALRKQNIDFLFNSENGLITLFTSTIANASPETYTLIQRLLDHLKSEFLDQTFELFDPYITDESAGGGWVLALKKTCEHLNTQTKYERFLLHIIEEVENSPEFFIVKEVFALLKVKLSSHQLTELLQEKFTKGQPWSVRKGGDPKQVAEMYYDQMVRPQSLHAHSNSYEEDLNMLYTCSHLMELNMLFEKRYSKMFCESPRHAYNLLSHEFAALQKFTSFKELKTSLSLSSQKMANIQVDAILGQKITEALYASERFPSQTLEKIPPYIEKHPIPSCTLREFALKLTDVLLRMSTKKGNYITFAGIVEEVIVNMEEFKDIRPTYQRLGDFNWIRDGDACYSAYSCSFMSGEIELYMLNGNSLCPLYFKLSSGITINGPIPDAPWKPLY